MNWLWLGVLAWMAIIVGAALVGTRMGRAGHNEDRKMLRGTVIPVDIGDTRSTEEILRERNR